MRHEEWADWSGPPSRWERARTMLVGIAVLVVLMGVLFGVAAGLVWVIDALTSLFK